MHKFHVNAYLSFAGEAPAYEGTAYARRLRRLTDKLNLKDRVTFLGEVDDLSAIRSESDAELVCSWMEPFGRTTVEAMLAGLPVVGTAAGGTAEIIADGKTGLLYPPRDAAALSDRLDWLHTYPQKAWKMGRVGRERVLARFTAQQTVSHVMEVLHELL